MASGTINLNLNIASGAMTAYVKWSSTPGNGGSTVNATLYVKTTTYWNYYNYRGCSITINGDKKTGSGARVYNTGTFTMMSHSKWVPYTGNKSITISATLDLTDIWYITGQYYLGTYSGSGTCALDTIGTKPTACNITAPTTATVAESTNSIQVVWTAGSSNTTKYRLAVSCDGGSYSTISSSISKSTTSYTYKLPTVSPGTTYRFRLGAGNDVGWSDWDYSGTVTLNSLTPPTIGNISTYNPYATSNLTINLSGGSQKNGESFKRMCALYYESTKLKECNSVSNGNTSAIIAYAASSYAAKMGSSVSSDKFKIVAWSQNSNGTKSSTVSKNFTVDLNSDGGANPIMGSMTISGGTLGYSSTCFVAGVTNVVVTAGTVTVPRQGSTGDVTYKISCTGMTTVNARTATFSGLTAGEKTIKITATDSRGLSVSQTKKIVVQSYSAPKLKIKSASRSSADPTIGIVTFTTSYSPIYQYPTYDNPGTQLNNIAVSQIARNDTGAYTGYASGGNVVGLNTDFSYKVTIRIADAVRSTNYISANTVIPTINVYMSYRSHGIGLGCIARSGYRLDVGGKSYFEDDTQHNGKIILENGNGLFEYDSSGKLVELISITSGGNIAIGDTSADYCTGNTIVYSSTGKVVLNSLETLIIASSSSFSKNLYFGGSSYWNTSSSIGRYWKDTEAHQVLSMDADGLTTSLGWAGSSTYKTVTNLRGQTVQCKGSTTWTSDENLKYDICDFGDNISNFFMDIKPRQYKYTLGSSGRTHFGYISQEVEEALVNNNLTTKDFAGVVITPIVEETETNDKGEVVRIEGSESNYLLDKGINEQHNLAYTEFIALNTYMIQQCMKEIKRLNKVIEEMTQNG